MLQAIRRRLSRISARILIVLAIPVAGMLVVAGQVMWDRRTTAVEMDRLSRMVELSTRMSALVHELQKERGSSAVFLGSGGKLFQAELQAQRQATDTARAALLATLPRNFDLARPDALGATMRSAVEQINQLDGRRAAVSTLQVEGAANTAAYTATITPLIDGIGRIVGESADTAVTQALTIFYNLEQAKERAGRERAAGALALGLHRLDPPLYRLFMSIVAEEESYFRSYDVFATPADRELLAGLVAGPEVAAMMALRQLMLDTPIGTSLATAPSDHWFRIATVRIELIRRVENAIADRMVGVARDARDRASRGFWIACGTAGGLLILGGFVGVLTARGIVRPVVAMTASMRALASGDRTIEIPAQGQSDEIGEMAQAVAVFKQTAIENDVLTENTAREHAIQARQQAAIDRHTQDFGASISGVMHGLVRHAEAMRQAACTMSDAVASTRQATSVAADDAATSSRDLTAVAEAADAMRHSVAEIGQQVSEVTAAVRDAVSHSTATDRKVGELAETTQRIVGVVRLINSIAGQTNLLALNATIESARAGEAGKGFAVVAGEVKALAKQTAIATEQIGAQINEIVAATEDAKQAARTVAQAIERVDAVAAVIAAAVDKQAAATDAIGRSVQTVSTATAEAEKAMDSVRTIAEQTDAASTSVLATADEVGHVAETLRVEVTDFLEAMCRHDGDRRAYERASGNGARATLHLRGLPAAEARVRDISRGGAALLCAAETESGTGIRLDLPPVSGIAGRVVRQEPGCLIVAFRQSAENLAAVDQALAAIAAAPGRRAA